MSNIKEALTFDDVLLVPQYSEVNSRSDVILSTSVGRITLDLPIISANMESITDFHMAKEMGENGAMGILHRYKSEDTIIQWLKWLKQANKPAFPSVGVMDSDLISAEKYREYTDCICVDIAHGDSAAMVRTIGSLKSLGFNTIIAGNVATKAGTLRLINAGANVVKVGVGGGSVCTTRIVTGHGYPQLSSIMEAVSGAAESGRQVSIIADGGIRNSGDIVKALAVGADAVMCGSLFAGCFPTPSHTTKVYRGMASHDAQMEGRGRVGNGTPEGVSVGIERKSSAKEVLEQLAGGIRSGCSYSGAKNLNELRENAQLIRITNSGMAESHPHALKSQ